MARSRKRHSQMGISKAPSFLFPGKKTMLSKSKGGGWLGKDKFTFFK